MNWLSVPIAMSKYFLSSPTISEVPELPWPMTITGDESSPVWRLGTLAGANVVAWEDAAMFGIIQSYRRWRVNVGSTYFVLRAEESRPTM